jgi:integrase
VPSVTRKTVDDVVAAWLTHAKKVSGVSAATYRGYESLGVVMRERLGRRTEVRSLRAKDIRQMQSELLDAKLARSTVHHQMTATRAAFSLAKENGWIDANPADGVKIVPLPKVEPDFNVLEPSQVERVAAAVATVPDGELPRMRNGELWEDLATKVVYTRTLWADLVRIAAYTGLRIGELRALAWGDIDWKGQVLRVTRNLPATAPAGTKPKAPKSGKARPVPLIPQAIEALRRVEKLGHPTGPKDLVFPSLDGGPSTRAGCARRSTRAWSRRSSLISARSRTR